MLTYLGSNSEFTFFPVILRFLDLLGVFISLEREVGEFTD